MKQLPINEEKANFLLACIDSHGKTHGAKVFKSCAIMIEEIQSLFVPPLERDEEKTPSNPTKEDD